MPSPKKNNTSFSFGMGPLHPWMSDRRQEKFDQLHFHSTRPASVSVITAAPGGGKTTVAALNYLQCNLEHFETLLIRRQQGASFDAAQSASNPLLTQLEFYLSAKISFPTTEKANSSSVLRGLAGLAKANRQFLLMMELDERDLTAAMLAPLSNLLVQREIFDHCLSLVILCNDSHRSLLNSSSTIRDRIGFEWAIPPLDEDEAMSYIRHGCTLAGLDADFFHERAMQIMYEHSEGSFTRINTVADASLVEAWRQGSTHGTAELVSSICEARQKPRPVADRAPVASQDFSAQESSQTHLASRLGSDRRRSDLVPLAKLLLDEEAS